MQYNYNDTVVGIISNLSYPITVSISEIKIVQQQFNNLHKVLNF